MTRVARDSSWEQVPAECGGDAAEAVKGALVAAIQQQAGRRFALLAIGASTQPEAQQRQDEAAPRQVSTAHYTAVCCLTLNATVRSDLSFV